MPPSQPRTPYVEACIHLEHMDNVYELVRQLTNIRIGGRPLVVRNNDWLGDKGRSGVRLEIGLGSQDVIGVRKKPLVIVKKEEDATSPITDAQACSLQIPPSYIEQLPVTYQHPLAVSSLSDFIDRVLVEERILCSQSNVIFHPNFGYVRLVPNEGQHLPVQMSLNNNPKLEPFFDVTASQSTQLALGMEAVNVKREPRDSAEYMRADMEMEHALTLPSDVAQNVDSHTGDHQSDWSSSLAVNQQLPYITNDPANFQQPIQLLERCVTNINSNALELKLQQPIGHYQQSLPFNQFPLQ